MYENIILIPYRNREKHLDYFIKNTVPLIQENLPNTKVVVIEQNDGELFNRGMVLNIGFKEYQNKTKYFLTHDVDINPTIKCIKEHFIKEVNKETVLGIYTSEHDTLGGIIKINDPTIHKINGFPNDIWGWGNEDKALQNRAEYYKIKKFTNLTTNYECNEYILRFDDINDRNKSNINKNWYNNYVLFNKLNDKQKEELIMSSGLNNLEYNVIERKMIHDIVELIKVDI